MASNIYKQKGGTTWWGRIWISGRELRRSLRTDDEHEALLRVAEWKRELRQQAEDGPQPTYKEAVVLWGQTTLAGSDSEGLKPAARKRYLLSARSLDLHFRDLRLKEIDKRAIGAYVAQRKRQGVTNATIRRDLTALSSIFRAACAAGLWDENPARLWDRTVIRERRRVFTPPTDAEIETVAAAATPAFGKLIRFAAATGVRLNEAVGLEWRDVRAERGEVVLSRTKTNRARVIALRSPGGDAMPVLTGIPRHLRSSLVFWHDDGEHYQNASGSFRELSAGVRRRDEGFPRFRFHDLRHAFAVRWLVSGGDLYALSRHLGHTSVKTTEVYLAWLHRHEDRQNPTGLSQGWGRDAARNVR
jgi:integrase